MPEQENFPYYVYGVWNMYDTMPLVIGENGEPELHRFEELDEALAFIKKETEKNVNINWCLTSNPDRIKPTCRLTGEQAIDLVDAIKDFCFLTGIQVYPLVSYLCLNHYIENWKCIDDVFYIDGKQVAP